jgi:MFS family permease
MWMPCSRWKWDTWCGLAAILSGMLCQAGMGVVSIWGNIVIYIVSKFHVTEQELTTQFALIVFPTTYAVGSIAMQLGSYLMDRIHPRLQMSLGMVIFVLSMYCA